MKHDRETKSDRRERPEPTDRRAAPPIEREHETYDGVFEEEEHRERRDGDREER